jgi:hypothetical protein
LSVQYIVSAGKNQFSSFPRIPEEAAMTDPVDRINGSREVDRNSGRGGTFKGEKPKRRGEPAGDDNVDISDEARERSSGGAGRKTP